MRRIFPQTTTVSLVISKEHSKIKLGVLGFALILFSGFCCLFLFFLAIVLHPVIEMSLGKKNVKHAQ